MTKKKEIQKLLCYFCHQAIEPQEFQDGKAVLMRQQNNEQIAAHVRHHGVQEEYDRQVGVL